VAIKFVAARKMGNRILAANGIEVAAEAGDEGPTMCVLETLGTNPAEVFTDFYGFQCDSGATDSGTIQFKFEGLSMPGIVDYGASCNNVSETAFRKIAESTNHQLNLRDCTSKVYTYASSEPLNIVSKCAFKVEVPETVSQTLLLYMSDIPHS